LYYRDLIGGTLARGSALLFAPLVAYLFLRPLAALILSAYRNTDPKKLFALQAIGGHFRKFGLELLSIIQSFAPVILLFAFLYLFIAASSASLTGTLADDSLYAIDAALFRTPPFIALGNLRYPDWIVIATHFSYVALVVMLFPFALLLFLFRREAFERFATALGLATVIMLPGWILAPALAPQARLIDNSYQIPVTAEISAHLASYAPQPALQRYLQDTTALNAKAQYLPLSTFPSAHIAWAVIVGFTAFMAHRVLFAVLAPILALSSFGTLFLAQHYFIDLPAGAFSAIAALFLSKYLLRRHSLPRA
jgi:hypothetical protein